MAGEDTKKMLDFAIRTVRVTSKILLFMSLIVQRVGLKSVEARVGKMTEEWKNSLNNARLGMTIEGGERFKLKEKNEDQCWRDEKMIVKMMKLKLGQARVNERRMRKEMKKRNKEMTKGMDEDEKEKIRKLVQKETDKEIEKSKANNKKKLDWLVNMMKNDCNKHVSCVRINKIDKKRDEVMNNNKSKNGNDDNKNSQSVRNVKDEMEEIMRMTKWKDVDIDIENEEPAKPAVYGEVDLDEDELVALRMRPEFALMPKVSMLNMREEEELCHTKVRWERGIKGSGPSYLLHISQLSSHFHSLGYHSHPHHQDLTL